MALAEPLHSAGIHGTPRSPGHVAVVQTASNEIVARLNEVTPDCMGDVLASVMLTIFLNQPDPVAAYNFIIVQVAAAIRHQLTPAMGNA